MADFKLGAGTQKARLHSLRRETGKIRCKKFFDSLQFLRRLQQACAPIRKKTCDSVLILFSYEMIAI